MIKDTKCSSEPTKFQVIRSIQTETKAIRKHTGQATKRAGWVRNPCSSHDTSSDGKRREGPGLEDVWRYFAMFEEWQLRKYE